MGTTVAPRRASARRSSFIGWSPLAAVPHNRLALPIPRLVMARVSGTQLTVIVAAVLDRQDVIGRP